MRGMLGAAPTDRFASVLGDGRGAAEVAGKLPDVVLSAPARAQALIDDALKLRRADWDRLLGSTMPGAPDGYEGEAALLQRERPDSHQLDKRFGEVIFDASVEGPEMPSPVGWALLSATTAVLLDGLISEVRAREMTAVARALLPDSVAWRSS